MSRYRETWTWHGQNMVEAEHEIKYQTDRELTCWGWSSKLPVVGDWARNGGWRKRLCPSIRRKVVSIGAPAVRRPMSGSFPGRTLNMTWRAFQRYRQLWFPRYGLRHFTHQRMPSSINSALCDVNIDVGIPVVIQMVFSVRTRGSRRRCVLSVVLLGLLPVVPCRVEYTRHLETVVKLRRRHLVTAAVASWRDFGVTLPMFVTWPYLIIFFYAMYAINFRTAIPSLANIRAANFYLNLNLRGKAVTKRGLWPFWG